MAVTISITDFSPTGNKFFNWLRSWLPDGDVYDRSPLAVPYTKDPVNVHVVRVVSGISGAEATLVHTWIVNDEQFSNRYNVCYTSDEIDVKVQLKQGINTIYVQDASAGTSNMLRLNAYYIHYFLYLYALEFLVLRKKNLQGMQNLNADSKYGDTKSSWLWSGVDSYITELQAMYDNYLSMLGIDKPIGFTDAELTTLVKSLISAYQVGGTLGCFRLVAEAFGAQFGAITCMCMGRNHTGPQLGVVTNVAEVAGNTEVTVSGKNWVVDSYKNLSAEIYVGSLITNVMFKIVSNTTDVLTLKGTGLSISVGDNIYIRTSYWGVVKGSISPLVMYPAVATINSRYVTWGDYDGVVRHQRLKVLKNIKLVPSSSTRWFTLYPEVVDSSGYSSIQISTSSVPPNIDILTATESFNPADIKTDTDGFVTGIPGYKYVELTKYPLSVSSVTDNGDVDPTKEFDTSNYSVIGNTRYLCLGSNRQTVNAITVVYTYYSIPVIFARVTTNFNNVTDILFGTMLVPETDSINLKYGMLLNSCSALKYLLEMYFDDLSTGAGDNGISTAGSGSYVIECLGKTWTPMQWVGGQVRLYNTLNPTMLNWKANIVSNTGNTITIDTELPAEFAIGDYFAVINNRRYYTRYSILEIARKLLPTYKRAHVMFKKESNEQDSGAYYANNFYLDSIIK